MPSRAGPASGPAVEGGNILGLKVKEVPSHGLKLVVVEALSSDSPCNGIVNVNDIIFGINPVGPQMGSNQGNVLKMADFDKLISQVKPGTTIGLRVCPSGYKCNNYSVKIPSK